MTARESRTAVAESYTGRYRYVLCVYFETTNDVRAAIEREKQLKGWTRAKKEALIVQSNPQWHGLSVDWE